MHLPLSRAIAAHLDLLPEIGSTNAELVARASAGNEPDFSVVATTNQTAGRGRLGRQWVAPPGATVAGSVLRSPGRAPLERLGWVPLLAGLAMTRAVDSLVDTAEVSLKWPNDVQVDGLKVSGLLAELVPSADAVVVGAGLNLTMTAEQLPVPTATSLVLAGVSPRNLLDLALSRYLGELRVLWERFVASGLDAHSSGLRDAVTKACSTIGRNVRVELPGGKELFGLAEGVDEVGRLLVRSLADASLQPVAAGDVTHLRYE